MAEPVYNWPMTHATFACVREAYREWMEERGLDPIFQEMDPESVFMQQFVAEMAVVWTDRKLYEGIAAAAIQKAADNIEARAIRATAERLAQMEEGG